MLLILGLFVLLTVVVVGFWFIGKLTQDLDKEESSPLIQKHLDGERFEEHERKPTPFSPAERLKNKRFNEEFIQEAIDRFKEK